MDLASLLLLTVLLPAQDSDTPPGGAEASRQKPPVGGCAGQCAGEEQRGAPCLADGQPDADRAH